MDEKIQTLTQVPFMPLPQGALLPGDLLPLHIFEPRYRRMMDVIRKTNRVLAIATMIEGPNEEEPPVFDIMGVGRVVKDHLNADSTSDIVVLGLVRAEIVAEFGDEPFRQARVAIVPDGRAHAAEMFRLRRELLVALSGRLHRRSFQCDVTAGFDAGVLVDRIASLLELHPHERVEMLQSTDIGRRIRRLLSILRSRRHRRRLLDIIPSLHAYGLSIGATGNKEGSR